MRAFWFRAFRVPVLACWLALGALLSGVSPAGAQINGVELSVEDGDLGFGGHVRPGGWVPLRLTVDNPTADDLELRLGWTVSDADGDRVVAERTAVINAQRTERLWLYAPMPLGTEAQAGWTLQAAGASAQSGGSGESSGALSGAGVLPGAVSVRADPTRWVEPGTAMIALMSEKDLGLGDYAQQATQHEPLTVVRGLSLADLPDRAHGLGMLDAVIWTQDSGGDPAGAGVSPGVFSALREYVLRGGHLVIVLPAVGQTWTQSPLADLLPVPAARVRRVTGPMPLLGALRPEGVDHVSMQVFDLRDSPGTTALLRNADDEAVIVTARRGFGVVTLVGIDLTDSVYRKPLSVGKRRLWNTVFGWSAPVMNAAEVKRGLGREVQRVPTLKPASEMGSRQLGAFVRGRIAMQGTVSVILLVAMALLFLYVVVAAGSFGWVRMRKQAHLAWVAFVAVVAGFSALAWGGAWLARPTGLSAKHVSVMDVDPVAGVARVRSWVSLFVPRFGTARVALPGDAAGEWLATPTNTLGSLGVSVDEGGVGFLDAQRYVAEAALPGELRLPVRATTKRLTLDVLGGATLEVEAPSGGRAQLGPGAFSVIETPTHDLASGVLKAKLRHTLPGELHDVTVVYCPGEGYRGAKRVALTPWVWRPLTDAATGQRRPWLPGQTLEIDGRPGDALPLVRIPSGYTADRSFKDEGYLGLLLDQHGGVASAVGAGNDTIAREFALLGFFDAVPPPEFTDVGFPPPSALRRGIGRSLDLTDLLHGPGLIVVGHLRESPLPADWAVDGRRPPSEGWTVVRLIYDLEDAGVR